MKGKISPTEAEMRHELSAAVREADRLRKLQDVDYQQVLVANNRVQVARARLDRATNAKSKPLRTQIRNGPARNTNDVIVDTHGGFNRFAESVERRIDDAHDLTLLSTDKSYANSFDTVHGRLNPKP